MKYQLSDLIDLSDVEKLMTSLYQATGINHALVDNDGKVLTAVGWQKICTDFHRTNARSCARCRESDRYIFEHLHDGPCVGYDCLNGLVDYATPIIIDGEHLATIFTGQMFHQPPDLDFFRRQAAEFGFEEASYLEAVAEVPIVPRERMGDVMAFLVGLAQMLARNGLARLRQFDAERELAQRVAERTAELTLSEERYRSLTLATTQVVWTTGAKGEVTGDIPAWRAFTGQSVSQVAGYGRLGAVHPDDRDRIAKVWSHALATGAPYLTEYRLRRFDGEYRQVLAHGVPVMEEDGSIREWIGTCTDVSESRHAEAKARSASLYARRLIEASLDPLVTISPEGKITDVNRATEEATGVSRTELIGTDFADYFTEPEAARAGYRRVLATGEVRDYALTLRHLSGRTIDVLYNATLYRSEEGEVAGVFAAARDVTEHKRIERELTMHRQHLEELVDIRTRELTDSNERLQAINTELEAFSYSVSHDLRTPLRAIDGFSRFLQEEYAEALDAEGQRLLRIVRESTAHMGQLIDDILGFSRLGRTQMIGSEIDMEALVRSVWRDAVAAAPGRELTLELGQLPRAYGDPAMLRRVFANLLENAVKFTAPRPAAVIGVSGRREPDRREVSYSVKDNGVGFDMRYVDKLFGVFQRLHGQEQFGGTGIGLATVKRIVTRHGGRVWAESRLGEGAAFHFALPAKDDAHG